MTKSLGTYDTMLVSVTAQQPAHEGHTARLAHAVKKSIEERGTIANVVVEPEGVESGIELRIVLLSIEGGSKVARTMNLGGETEMKVSCELVEIGATDKVGAFSVTGDSSRKVRTSVNGVDTSIADDLVGRAIGAVAEEVATYLANPS